MSTPSNPHWLLDLWRRRRDNSVADAADLGTAFGLDMSMIPDDEESSAAASTAATGGPRWLRRLMRRQPG